MAYTASRSNDGYGSLCTQVPRKDCQTYLAVVELYKFRYKTKLSTFHIKGTANISGDFLSRGKIPTWLQKWGFRRQIKLRHVLQLLNNPLPAWEKECTTKM